MGCGVIICWIKLIGVGFFELVLRIDLYRLTCILAIVKNDEANAKICSSLFFDGAIYNVSSINARIEVDICSWFVCFNLRYVIQEASRL